MRGSATTYWPSSIRLPLRWPTATTLFAGGRCVLETLRSGFAFIAAFTTSICAEVFGIQGRSAAEQSHFHTRPDAQVHGNTSDDYPQVFDCWVTAAVEHGAGKPAWAKRRCTRIESPSVSSLSSKAVRDSP